MPSPLFVSYAREDVGFANFYKTRLEAAGYTVFIDVDSLTGGTKWEQQLELTIRSSLAVITLVSPESNASIWVEKECTWARTYRRPLIPVQIRTVDKMPWYLHDIHVINGATDFEAALTRVIESLPKPTFGITFGEARDRYLQRATLRSQHTIDAYRRAIELFFDFISDRKSNTSLLPIQNQQFVIAEQIPLAALAADDAPILLHFAQWLLSANSGRPEDNRPYKPTTVELRVSGVQNWLQYLDDYGWLPPDFPLARARRIVTDEVRNQVHTSGPPQPPDHIGEVIYYYDTQQPPKRLQKPDADPERLERWQLTRLRNRALLHALAETGGRISEVLSLNLADFPPRYLERGDVLRVEVQGKGGHNYYLRFYDSLAAIRDYIRTRGANLRGSAQGNVPLFVSHDPRFDGNRMSRVVAWRVVQRAAKALGLGNITPHDFRHWRATQLINDGHSLDVVQDYLGHRSVETTRAYYAHTDPLRVDDAAKNTPLPGPDSDD